MTPQRSSDLQVKKHCLIEHSSTHMGMFGGNVAICKCDPWVFVARTSGWHGHTLVCSLEFRTFLKDV